MSLSSTSLAGVWAHQRVPWRAALLPPEHMKGVGIVSRGGGGPKQTAEFPRVQSDPAGPRWLTCQYYITEACSLHHPSMLTDFGLKYCILSVKMYKERWDSGVCAGVIGIKGVVQHFDSACRIKHIGLKNHI